MWSILFSVDYLGAGGYINTRALDVVFSFLCFLARACCAGGSPGSVAPIALVYAPINRFLRGTGGSDFFCQFSPHFIPSLGCFAYLRSVATRLPSYPYLPAPLPATFDTDGRGGSWLRYD